MNENLDLIIIGIIVFGGTLLFVVIQEIKLRRKKKLKKELK